MTPRGDGKRSRADTGSAALPATESHEEGLVIVNYSRHAVVETPDGRRITCLVRGKRQQPVCGDRVRWRPLPEGGGLIQEILPRRTELFRHDLRGRRQTLVANLDRLFVVCAPQPPCEPFLLDKYLVAASALGVEAVLLLNKRDLLDEMPDPALDALLEEYRGIGYTVMRVSARTGTGMAELRDAARGHLNVLVGPSGAGKSSLIRALLPGIEIETGELSDATGEGRHTTTRTTLYHLPEGGDLVDSPGVRDFMLWPMPVVELRAHFPEFRWHASGCRFADCTHRREPDCAVKQAVEAKAIPRRRYESYLGLARIMEERRYEALR